MTIRTTLVAIVIAIATLLPASGLAQSSSSLPPVDLGTEDIRELRGPVELPAPWWVVYGPWIAGAVALAGAGFVVHAAWRRRRGSADARTIAIAELERARVHIDHGEPERFSDAASDALRRYVEARFAIHAPTRTTDELLHELADDVRSPLREHRARLVEILAFCDRARFSGFALAHDEMLQMHAHARRFVDESWSARDEAVVADALDREPSTGGAS